MTLFPLSYRPHTSSRRGGFTLVELLTVISIIAILAALLFPMVGSMTRQADSAKCTSNLRQIGMASVSYASDNDGFLPGPLWGGQAAWFTNSDKSALPFLLAKYAGVEKTKAGERPETIFSCPAFAKNLKKVSPTANPPSLSMGSSRNVYRVGTTGNVVYNAYYFGYPTGADAQEPMRLIETGTMVDKVTGAPIPASSLEAIKDLDQKGTQSTTADWYSSLPKGPVHVTHRNALFLDWHVESVNKGGK